MKKYINTIVLGAFIVILALVFGFITIKATEKYAFEKTAPEMLEKVTTENQFITLDMMQDALENKDPEYLLIDIRNPREFVNDHIRNARNIPYERLLDDEFRETFENNQIKVLYGSSVMNANAAWLILTQYGYDNLKVLEGNVDDWHRFVENPDVFGESFKAETAAKHDFSDIMEEN